VSMRTVTSVARSERPHWYENWANNAPKCVSPVWIAHLLRRDAMSQKWIGTTRERYQLWALAWIAMRAWDVVHWALDRAEWLRRYEPKK
jgi:hypothetical protein